MLTLVFLSAFKFLFWSKTRTLMHSYAAVFRDFWTLEDTLVGYMFNDLVWCGQDEDSGESYFGIRGQRSQMILILYNGDPWQDRD